MSNQNATNERVTRTLNPQPIEHRVIKLRPNETSASNAIGLFQEGEILNREGRSKAALDSYIATLPPIKLLTDEQMLANTTVEVVNVSSGTTVQIVVSLPQEVFEQLIQERKLTRLSEQSIELEIINFVDEDGVVLGSDKVYEAILNNLLQKEKLSRQQVIFLMKKIRWAFKYHRNEVRNIDISVKDDNNRTVNVDEIDQEDQEGDDPEEELVSNYLAGREDRLRNDQIIEPRERNYPVNETREQRHNRLRQVGNMPINLHERPGFRRVEEPKDSGEPNKRSRRRKRASEEVTTTEKVVTSITAVAAVAIIVGQAYAGIELANYFAEVFQIQKDVVQLVIGLGLIQLIPSLGYSVINSMLKSRRGEFKNNYQVIRSFSKDYFLMGLVALASVGLITYPPTKLFDFFVNHYQLQGQSIDAQFDFLETKIIHLASNLIAFGIGAAIIIGMLKLALKNRRERHGSVDSKTK